MAYDLKKNTRGSTGTTVEVSAFISIEKVADYAMKRAFEETVEGELCPLANFEDIYPNRRALMVAVKKHVLMYGIMDFDNCDWGTAEEQLAFVKKVKAFWGVK